MVSMRQHIGVKSVGSIELVCWSTCAWGFGPRGTRAGEGGRSCEEAATVCLERWPGGGGSLGGSMTVDYPDDHVSPLHLRDHLGQLCPQGSAIIGSIIIRSALEFPAHQPLTPPWASKTSRSPSVKRPNLQGTQST